MIKIQKQEWTRTTRYVMTDEHGSCQLEIYAQPRGENRVKAWICNLWVDPGHRRQGIARRLMETAEELARREGQKEVWLHWWKNDAKWPDGNHALKIFDWYVRRGYEEVEFGDFTALMRKEL